MLERLRKILIISTEPEARSAELMIRTKDGRERLWSFVTSPQASQSDGRRLFVCVAQDVTVPLGVLPDCPRLAAHAGGAWLLLPCGSTVLAATT